MRTMLLSLFGSVVLLGCAGEKRLGESRIEARRYARGFHVQHHRAPKPQPQPATGLADVNWVQSAVTSTDVEAVESLADSPNASVSVHPSDSRDAEVAAPSSMRMMSRRTRAEVPQMKQPVLLESEVLPEPVDGYHPNAVPGFILSMGWALGIIGEIAIEYLQMPLSGVAIALGILCSIAGYALSRKAYRDSLAHPELYPRYRLSRAARFVSIGFLAPIALYVGLVLLVFLFVGGFGLF